MRIAPQFTICLLISVIAPDIASGIPSDFAALGVTIVATTRLPLPATVIVVSAAAALGHAASAVAL